MYFIQIIRSMWNNFFQLLRNSVVAVGESAATPDADSDAGHIRHLKYQTKNLI